MGPAPRALGRLVFALATIAVLALSAGNVQAAGTADAGAFLGALKQRATQQLGEAGIGRVERERRFRALLEQSFSIPTIGRFVLGRYWRAAGAQERRAFLKVFEDLIVKRYLPLFTEISTARLEIDRVSANPNNPKLVAVASRIQGLKRDPISIEWRIRDFQSQYKIVDIVAEGVSLAITMRSSYGAYMSRHGGDVRALVGSLRDELAAGNFGPIRSKATALN